MVMAHWNWLGAQVTSAAGGRRGVRRGSRAGRDQPPLAPKTSRGAGRCVGAPGITRVWCARQRGWSRAIKWPQKTPSYGGTGQTPPDPSAGQQAQPKSTSRDLRISFPLRKQQHVGAGGDRDGGSAEKALGHPREPNTPRHGPEPLSVAHARSHPTPRAPHSRQSFSSSPSPQLSCPLQRKMPGMQRLVLVHLNWLGRQTWMSGEEVTRSGG